MLVQVREMDTIFTKSPIVGSKSVPWSFAYDHALLLTSINQAQREATRLGHAVLASVTLPVDPCDPLDLLRAFQSLDAGDCLFWAQPSEHRALVGVGAATTIETTGSMRCATAATAWRALLHVAVVSYASTPPLVQPENPQREYREARSSTRRVSQSAQPTAEKTGGPILLGGFSFDPLRPGTELWHGFSDGLLILPRLLLHCNGDQYTLTVNLMVQASDESERRLDEMTTLLQHLLAAMEYVGELPQETLPEVSRTPLTAHDMLPAEEWKALVAKTARLIRRGVYEKVVLARGVEVTRADEPFEIGVTLQRLRTNYPGAYIFAIQRGPRYFVGATPERLVRAEDGQLQAMALAGSTPRGATEEEDARLGTELLQSEKNKIEHAIVVSTIRNALAQACSKVWVADTPHLRRLKNIQHLETAIFGEMLPGRCVLEAIEGLFPTPAVGGVPRESALAFIRAEEQLDRGWYAGAIGCIDASGNGEFAVALRSALIDGEKATLFGGCGIVGDSNPESEYAESCWKLQVMLRGLSGED